MAIHLKKTTWVFFSLFLLFIVPLLLASWMVIKRQPLFSHTTNHGGLIQPPLDIAKLEVMNNSSRLTGYWVLLLVSPTPCDEQCEKALYNMRQIHTALGKDANRVRRAILTFAPHATDERLRQLLRADFQGTTHWIVARDKLARFLQPQASKDMALQGGVLYLVDPLGNVMMFYSLDSPPMGIFNDMTRLLKLSQVG